MRVGRNNTKSFECCKDVLQLARSGQIPSLRLNVLEFQEYIRVIESGEVLPIKKCFNGENN